MIFIKQSIILLVLWAQGKSYAFAKSGVGPNFAYLDGGMKKSQFSSRKHETLKIDSEAACVLGLKGRDILAQGNALG